MRCRADRREHVLHEREVQHLLGADVGDRPPPASDGLELLRREPLVLALLERERREQVLAHDPVLELGGLTQHVDQRLAMLDDELGLGLRPSTARRQDLREATPSGAAGRIIHSGTFRAPAVWRERRPRPKGHRRLGAPNVGSVTRRHRSTLIRMAGPPLWVSWTSLTACSAAPRARAPSRARNRRPSPSPAKRAADAGPRTARRR